eukprot:2414448-Prymnesium_polylepis.1
MGPALLPESAVEPRQSGHAAVASHLYPDLANANPKALSRRRWAQQPCTCRVHDHRIRDRYFHLLPDAVRIRPPSGAFGDGHHHRRTEGLDGLVVEGGTAPKGGACRRGGNRAERGRGDRHAL